MRTQLQNVQIELNRFRYKIDEKDEELRRQVQASRECWVTIDRLNVQLRMKEQEIERLRREQLNPVIPPPLPPQINQEVWHIIVACIVCVQIVFCCIMV